MNDADNQSGCLRKAYDLAKDPNYIAVTSGSNRTYFVSRHLLQIAQDDGRAWRNEIQNADPH